MTPLSVPDYEKATDEELMVRYIGGDEIAFQEIFERYRGRIYAYLKRRISDAKMVDDLFQTTFLNLHRSRGRYSEKHPFSAWLFAVCRNVVRDHFRTRRKHAPEVLGGDLAKEAAAVSDEGVSSATLLAEALTQVTPRERQSMSLRYEAALDFDAIARSMNTTPQNVRQLLSRGVRKVRRILK